MQYASHLFHTPSAGPAEKVIRIGMPRRAFLGLAGSSALLAACSGKSGPGGTETLRLQNWFTNTDMSAWNVGLNAAKKKYPNIGIKLEFVDYNDTVNKTMAEATARNMPDLIMASNEHVPTLSANGLLLKLDDYISKNPSVKPDDFAPGVAQGFHLDGHWWGFPYDVSTFAIYYNKDLFKKAGVALPPGAGEAPWSWDDLVKAAKALTDPSKKRWGLMWWDADTNAWDNYMASNFIYSAGGRNFSDDLKSCLINSPESARALQFLVDLIHKHKVAPLPSQTAGGAVDYFQSGFSAMYLDGSFSLGTRVKTLKFPFDVSPFPIDKQPRIATGGSGFCISASTKHPDECWQWLSEFTSATTLRKMIGDTGRGIPARKSAADAFAAQFSTVKNAKVFVEELASTFNDRSVLAYNEFTDAFNRAMEPIFRSGNGDISAGLQTVATTTNKALTQKWQQAGAGH